MCELLVHQARVYAPCNTTNIYVYIFRLENEDGTCSYLVRETYEKSGTFSFDARVDTRQEAEKLYDERVSKLYNDWLKKRKGKLC